MVVIGQDNCNTEAEVVPGDIPLLFAQNKTLKRAGDVLDIDRDKGSV